MECLFVITSRDDINDPLFPVLINEGLITVLVSLLSNEEGTIQNYACGVLGNLLCWESRSAKMIRMQLKIEMERYQLGYCSRGSCSGFSSEYQHQYHQQQKKKKKKNNNNNNNNNYEQSYANKSGIHDTYDIDKGIDISIDIKSMITSIESGIFGEKQRRLQWLGRNAILFVPPKATSLYSGHKTPQQEEDMIDMLEWGDTFAMDAKAWSLGLSFKITKRLRQQIEGTRVCVFVCVFVICVYITYQ